MNGNLVVEKETERTILKSIYNFLDLKYSKFHKMDIMSKVSILGVELLKQHVPAIQQTENDDIAVVFSNANASAYTDELFEQSYKEGAPSPSLFVYTLPNILIGELAIKNKWYGENIFTVSEEFDTAFYEQHCSMLLGSGKAEVCVCGWVNIVGKDDFEACFFVVEKEQSTSFSIPLETKNLFNLYK